MCDFSSRLLTWYDINKRELPWRGETAPYRIWLSEIMLQQTRVEAVIGYYHRFLDACPTVGALAEAPIDQVLKLWEGLGYYSRARSLHAAARIVVDEMDGAFPRTSAELRRLPGIGPYTANAIASIAFGECVPALDGNQARVLARVLGWSEPLNTPFDLEEAASARMSKERPGDHNQALMDLSATVCLPRSPRCGTCPFVDLCAAHGEGEETAYPARKPPIAKRVEQRTILVLYTADDFVVERRPAKGLLGGLMQFPNVEGHMEEDELTQWLRQHGFTWREDSVRRLQDAKHVFTHLIWDMRGYAVALTGTPEKCTLAQDLDAIAMPTALRAYREAATRISIS